MGAQAFSSATTTIGAFSRLTGIATSLQTLDLLISEGVDSELPKLAKSFAMTKTWKEEDRAAVPLSPPL